MSARQAGWEGRAFGDRYVVARLIKSAAGVSTYLGVDRRDGSDVVIKAAAAATVPPATRLRLEHEADVLRRLEGGSSAALVDAGRDGDDIYLVQRHLAGVTLRDRLAGGALSVDEALAVGADVLHALVAAHDVGVLHRDVKPANVMLTEERAVLIDFGFARSAWLEGPLHDDAVGSARYMAPEQAGVIDVAPDERADLYSLGVVLFECLAGRPPFLASTVGEVLRQHANEAPPTLRGLGVTVPRAVDAIVERLLRKDPAERYQTAVAVLDDITEVRRARLRGIDEPALVPGVHERRRTLAEPAFVGRIAELAALSEAVSAAERGSGGLVVVEAESGGGKTRLLAELEHLIDGQRAWILRGQGVDQVGQRPFQVLEGVAESLLAAAEDDPDLVDAVLDRVGEDAEALADALPELAELIGHGVDPDGGIVVLGPEAYGERRSVQALPSLLHALGSPDRAAVVLLDDCQWADAVTAKMLARWNELSSAGACHVLVVVAFRSEEVAAGHPLRALTPMLSVALPPFSASDVHRLAESMAGPLPEEALATVARLSEGSPFMASAVLRGLVESRALIGGPEGWEVRPTAMADVQTSRQAATFLIRRLELLSDSGLRLLSIGAVLGKEFELALAVSLADASPGEAVPALDEARRRRILWLDEQGARCAFFHDKLREALLARLDDDERSALHLRAAERVEALDRDRVFELAYHFDAAGEAARALPYALAAGERARAQHSLEIAEAHYRIAARAADGTDDATRARVSEGLGDVLTLRGSYAEAADELEQARALASGRVARAQLDGKLGDVAFKCGDVVNALRWLNQALRQLGRRVPRTSFGYTVALVREVVVQLLHTLFPQFFVGRRSLEGADEELLAIRIYSRLAYVHWFHSGKVPCGWAHLREMNLAERYPPTLELAQAYSEHAPVMTMIPWTARGIEYCERSLAIRSELGDLWGQGQSLHFYGVVLYAASRYRECIAKCRDAVRLLERTGDRWEVNTALWHIAFSHYRLGELRSAVELARRIYDAATEIGDQAAAGISLSAWARASGGRIPADIVHTALDADAADAHTASEIHLAEAVRLLGDDRPDEAVDVLEAARAIVRRAGLRQEYVAPVAPWLATALRVCAERESVYAPGRRRAAVRRADRAARRAARVARSYPNNRPHALRERALVEAMRGRDGKARALLDRSLAAARTQGARFEEAQTRRARGAIGVARGWPDAESELGRGETEVAAFLADAAAATTFASQVQEPTLSLADRFSTLLESGRKVAAAASEEAVYGAVAHAARTLLRGERCEVIEVDDLGDPLLPFAELPGVSTTLLRRAVEERAPVVSGAELGADAADSLVLAGTRSTLCAPIVAEGKVTACLYVIHRQLGGLFGTDEERLAEFVCTLAGAALENVAGSEARFRSLAQNSTDVITIVSADGCVEYQSSSIERVFGYAPGELVGTFLQDWVHPDDASALLTFVEEAPQRRGGEALVACRLRHYDGTWRHAETTLNNLLHEPSVHGVVLNTRDVSERKELEEELRRRATHDGLTGLPNRTLFTDRVEQAVARGRRAPAPLALLFLDLDDFKSVNDSLGHAAGDLVLRAVAERLAVCVRPDDTIARFGGDEFAILLDGANETEAVTVAQRIIEEMRFPFSVLDHELHVRASIGVRTGAGDERAEDLLSSADVAMYTAKGRGKARFEVFQSEMRSAALQRSSLKSNLEGALDRDELVVHYQPIVDLRSGRAVGVEALLRWDHASRGLLSPGEFIAIAEESGMIIPIGRWVLRTACENARRWQEISGVQAGFTLSVNISARQLQHPSLLNDASAALSESGLDPRCLTLELTETAMVHDTELVLARLAALHDLGVRLAVDDFGTGYSSLSYLHRLPFDVIKIDKSFIERIGDEPEPTLARAIVEIARSLRLDPVAEGIETAGQRDGLVAMGCELGQGYHFCRPLPADAIDDLLRSGGVTGGCSSGTGSSPTA